ncbi:ergothioneine biosynthesis protein EgtB [Natronospira bacteriovora]|uniref:Ergothioneine biosynthesis protein EgtB n=1 Tax=Natronospira bacteriovora TaxID=3069753 RepID=A0ABU0W8Z7_9GAMM|nr:ergothioneine biosynthesis protein EgtB [Natronospira sp. AB-CW4]MDQ2070507.1 ergothioneine biosynthesis protein EgtB [Natronospira sp. AB-CW4]
MGITRETGQAAVTSSAALMARYRAVRKQSEALAAPLSAEDMTVQTMPDVSPTKWHLAHTTWFFERFLLQEQLPGYRVFHPGFDYLFNSYYFTLGQMYQRPDRGLISRPGVEEIMAWRRHVDTAMEALIEQGGEDEKLGPLILLGTHHEQQHQELILTDIKHVLSANPLRPAYHERTPGRAAMPGPIEFIAGSEGIHELGFDGGGFAFDNEGPRHRTLLQPHAIANRLITNAEYRDFIRDGGYRDPALWLSDGWATVQQAGWDRPFYWDEELESEFTLAGQRALDPYAPVSHVSFYEADAFARWAGHRLPTEAEWEVTAREQPTEGHFVDSGFYHPGGTGQQQRRFYQLFGDVWEWTASPYAPYPGFRAAAGAVGEYNGKFMCNQMVLRGGSCVTPADHIRVTYRNFFYPPSRWQFTGIRLAKDL